MAEPVATAPAAAASRQVRPKSAPARRLLSVGSGSLYLVQSDSTPGANPLVLPPPPCSGRAYETLLEAAKTRVTAAIKVNLREAASKRAAERNARVHRELLSGSRSSSSSTTQLHRQQSQCPTGVRHSGRRRGPPVDKLEDQLGTSAPAAARNHFIPPSAAARPARPLWRPEPGVGNATYLKPKTAAPKPDPFKGMTMSEPLSTYFKQHYSAPNAPVVEKANVNLMWSHGLSAQSDVASRRGARGREEAALDAEMADLDERMAQLTAAEEGGTKPRHQPEPKPEPKVAVAVPPSGTAASGKRGGGGSSPTSRSPGASSGKGRNLSRQQSKSSFSTKQADAAPSIQERALPCGLLVSRAAYAGTSAQTLRDARLSCQLLLTSVAPHSPQVAAPRKPPREPEAELEEASEGDVLELRSRLGGRLGGLRERLLGSVDDEPADWSADWQYMASRQQAANLERQAQLVAERRHAPEDEEEAGWGAEEDDAPTPLLSAALRQAHRDAEQGKGTPGYRAPRPELLGRSAGDGGAEGGGGGEAFVRRGGDHEEAEEAVDEGFTQVPVPLAPPPSGHHLAPPLAPPGAIWRHLPPPASTGRPPCAGGGRGDAGVPRGDERLPRQREAQAPVARQARGTAGRALRATPIGDARRA